LRNYQPELSDKFHTMSRLLVRAIRPVNPVNPVKKILPQKPDS